MRKLLFQVIKFFKSTVWLFLFMVLSGNSCETKKETSVQTETKGMPGEPAAKSSAMQSSPLFVPGNAQDTGLKGKKNEENKEVFHNSENQKQLDSIKNAKDKEKGIKK